MNFIKMNYLLSFLLMIIMVCTPEASAQFVGGNFEAKVSGLTTALINQILPLLSVIGIFYASALAMNGSPEAKNRIILVIGCSIVGFLAPYLIQWLKAFAA
jgi:hypothetical protein